MERCSTTLFVNATRPRNLVITSPSPLFSTDLSNNTRVSRICCRRILAWFPFSLSLSLPGVSKRHVSIRDSRYLHKRRAISLFCIPLGGRVSGKTGFFCTRGQGQPMTAEWGMKGRGEREKIFFSFQSACLLWLGARSWIFIRDFKMRIEGEFFL